MKTKFTYIKEAIINTMKKRDVLFQVLSSHWASIVTSTIIGTFDVDTIYFISCIIPLILLLINICISYNVIKNDAKNKNNGKLKNGTYITFDEIGFSSSRIHSKVKENNDQKLFYLMAIDLLPYFTHEEIHAIHRDFMKVIAGLFYERPVDIATFKKFNLFLAQFSDFKNKRISDYRKRDLEFEKCSGLTGWINKCIYEVGSAPSIMADIIFFSFYDEIKSIFSDDNKYITDNTKYNYFKHLFMKTNDEITRNVIKEAYTRVCWSSYGKIEKYIKNGLDFIEELTVLIHPDIPYIYTNIHGNGKKEFYTASKFYNHLINDNEQWYTIADKDSHVKSMEASFECSKEILFPITKEPNKITDPDGELLKYDFKSEIGCRMTDKKFYFDDSYSIDVTDVNKIAMFILDNEYAEVLPTKILFYIAAYTYVCKQFRDMLIEYFREV